MSKRVIKICGGGMLILIAVMLLCCAVYRAGKITDLNNTVDKILTGVFNTRVSYPFVFSHQDRLGYWGGVRPHEMERLKDAQFRAGTFLEIPERVMKLPITVKYYTYENGEYQLAHTMKKGTKVYVWPLGEWFSMTLDGINTLPTYEKGWRYGSPFMLLSGERSGTLSPAFEGLYYVRLSDIQAVLRAYYRINIRETAGYPYPFATELDFVHLTSIGGDFPFYYKDGYKPPDLHYPVFDFYNIAYISAAGGLVLLHICARLYEAAGSGKRKMKSEARDTV